MLISRRLVPLVVLVAASPLAHADWMFRGTPNNWGTTALKADVAQPQYVSTCQQFVSGSDLPTRFKLNLNGDWAQATVPTQDYVVSPGWVKVVFNPATKTIVSVTQNMAANCATNPPEPTTDKWYLRGTSNNWAGTLMTAVAGSNQLEVCQQFVAGSDLPTRFKINLNNDWSKTTVPTQDYVVTPGWVKVTFDPTTKTIVQVSQKLAANCQAPSNNWYVRGTYNAWGTTPMTSVGDGTYTADIATTKGGSPALIKIDDGAWGNPVPATGDGVTLDYCTSYTVTFNPSTKTITPIKIARLADSNCEQIAKYKDFRGETIYYVFMDRFSDGDATNNGGNNPATFDATKANWRKYFGGDIQGLINKLDYLQSIGVTAIWTTPMVDNTDFVETDLVQTGYHGYWAKDFFNVDEHLGDWTLFDKLIAEMNKRGMKLVMDFAPNHSTNGFDGSFGALYRAGTQVALEHPADARLPDAQQWFHHQGGIDGSKMNSCDSNDANCVPVSSCNSVNNCKSDWDAFPQTQNKDVYGLADLAVEKPQVEEYLVSAAKNFIDHGVSGFRIDAIKHFNDDFMRRFAKQVNDYAITKGRDGIYIFGEWYGAGLGVSKSLQFANTTDNVELLDFQLRNSIEGAIAGDKSMKTLDADIAARPAAWAGRDSYQATFLDNHDARRTLTYLRSSRIGKGMSEDFAKQRLDMGVALVMTMPGVPVVYYGTEQYTANFTETSFMGQVKVGEDPYNREMMPVFNNTTRAAKLMKALSALRKQSVAMQQGSYAQKWVSDDILVFERRSGTDSVVVAVNRGVGQQITVSNLGLANGTYTNLVGNDSVAINAGSAVIDLPQNAILVLH
jgi:glycosidase